MKWIRVTNRESIPLREGRCVDLGDREIAIFNLGEGKLMAIDAACPHRGGPLCDGIVTGGGALSLAGNAVVCPLHGWKISLDSGAVLRPEVCVRVETYPVQVIDGTVVVQLPAAKKVQQEEIAA